MKKEVTIEYDNIALVVVGEYEKGQDGSYMYPDFSSDFKVLCGGQDIIDILEQEVIDELENQAIEIIEEQW